MGSAWSYSNMVPSLLSRCRKRPFQETPPLTDDHIILTIDSLQGVLEKRIYEVEQQQLQYAQQCAHQQFQPYHVRLQESIQQIEVIKEKIRRLEAIQQSLLDNQVIAISP
jgi:hypothetical protein